MYIVNKIRGEMQSLPAKEIKSEQMKAMKSELAQKILHLLSNQSMYPIEIAKKLKQNEQKIYYHIHNLEKVGIIKIIKKGEIKGVIANYYGLTEPACWTEEYLNDYNVSSFQVRNDGNVDIDFTVTSQTATNAAGFLAGTAPGYAFRATDGLESTGATMVGAGSWHEFDGSAQAAVTALPSGTSEDEVYVEIRLIVPDDAQGIKGDTLLFTSSPN